MKDGGEQGAHEEYGVRIGSVLEKARREKGLSLRDVEDATKIRTRYLEGLEREDFSALPATVYVQGFLRTYANFLGLDGEGLAREFKDHWAPRRERQLNYERPRRSEFERPVVSPGGLAGTERRRVSGAIVATVALVLILLAALVGGLYLVGAWATSDDPSASVAPHLNPGEETSPVDEPAREEDSEPDEPSVAATAAAIANDAPVDAPVQATLGGSPTGPREAASARTGRSSTSSSPGRASSRPSRRRIS